MGLGIGADYPLSAVITAEFAPRKYRARMLSWVFFAQPLGQLLANVLSFAAVEGFRSQITNDRLSCGVEDLKCLRAIDRLWRLVVGLGIIPAAIALVFRFTIPESPRYQLDVLRNVQVVVEDTRDYFGTLKDDIEGGEMDDIPSIPTPTVPHSAARRPSTTSEIAPDQVVDSDSESEQRRSSVDQRPVRAPVVLSPSDPKYIPPLASWQDAKQYFIEEGNWRYLAGTSLSWLFLDCGCPLGSTSSWWIYRTDQTTVAFYGLGMSSPDIVRHIWEDPDDPRSSVFSSLRGNSVHSLVMVSIGATVGGALMIKVIKYASPKVIQFWGFLVLFVLFIVTGSAWTKLLDSSRSGLIVLYVLSQIAFNLGPNVTTFIVGVLVPFAAKSADCYRSPQRSFQRATDAPATVLLQQPGNSAPGLSKSSLLMDSKQRIRRSSTGESESNLATFFRL